MVFYILAYLFLIAIFCIGYVVIKKRMYIWLPSYITGRLVNRCDSNSAEAKHVIFCVVDHFEPGHDSIDPSKEKEKIKAWVDGYTAMAGKHFDADGRHPQHTWFYPPHHKIDYLKDLVGICNQGFGEIEMHLHHNHMPPFPDTPETLRAKIMKCIEDYSQYGIFCLPDGSKRFAFVHGDWSLDNSRGPEFCGVNNEISILRDCGCFADFTFPSLGKAQPKMVNKIFYCKDDQDRPKSYDQGRELETGGKPWGDLLIIPGIIGLNWKTKKRFYRPSIEASNIDDSDIPIPSRIDYWIDNAVKIKGKPNWLFIKMHMHGGKETNFDSAFGMNAERMHTYLESKYNDKKKYILHYVTARETYNIIKAAESNKNGDPNIYRDYEIGKYTYSARY